jgi:hypothetical protein
MYNKYFYPIDAVNCGRNLFQKIGKNVVATVENNSCGLINVDFKIPMTNSSNQNHEVYIIFEMEELQSVMHNSILRLLLDTNIEE